MEEDKSKEVVASDDTGIITRHYEDCPICGRQGTLKVYECTFQTWSQTEKSCSSCYYLERRVYHKESPN